ncbi:MAG: excinuclease ABC subunit UvrC, partial [Acutalibacteraceae bacterium]
VICDSEFEALILECSLIKEYSPKYNILLKDDKGYSFIKITNEKWPRISAVFRKEEDGAEYLGPYLSSFNVTQAVDEASKLFMLPVCGKKFPRDIGKSRPCLNAHIGRCCAVCSGRVKNEEYIESIEQAKSFLKGNVRELTASLTEKMEEAAEKLDFERAAKIRDRINALKKLGEKQKVFDTRIENQDVIAFEIFGEEGYVSVLSFCGGKVVGTRSYPVEAGEDPAAMRSSFIIQYYSAHPDLIPHQITVDEKIENAGQVEDWLSEKRGKKVKIHIPQRGIQLETVNMCRSSARQHYLLSLEKKDRLPSGVIELQKIAGLKNPPRYIEAYDISNTAGSENVAGMVVYRDGRPLKIAYRTFKIKSFEGQNDVGSVYEVLCRRFEEYKKSPKTEKPAEYGFAKLPDLILLDGGKGQLSAAKQASSDSGIFVPMLGMVKDDKHKTRALIGENGEIELKKIKSAYNLIYEIQEEVHRFAIGYHRRRSGKKSLRSDLTVISGIGEKRARLLLSHFKTVKA